MDYQPKAHAREPFPWLGLGFGVVLGLGLAIVAPWIVFNVHDVNLLKTR